MTHTMPILGLSRHPHTLNHQFLGTMEIVGLSRDPNTPSSPIFPAPCIQAFLRDFHSGYARVPSVSNFCSGATLPCGGITTRAQDHLAMQVHLSMIRIAGGWGCNELAIHLASTGLICRINAMLWIKLS